MHFTLKCRIVYNWLATWKHALARETQEEPYMEADLSAQKDAYSAGYTKA